MIPKLPGRVIFSKIITFGWFVWVYEKFSLHESWLEDNQNGTVKFYSFTHSTGISSFLINVFPLRFSNWSMLKAILQSVSWKTFQCFCRTCVYCSCELWSRFFQSGPDFMELKEIARCEIKWNFPLCRRRFNDYLLTSHSLQELRTFKLGMLSKAPERLGNAERS